VKVQFTIPGKIQAKERPRFGKKGKVYTPRKSLAFEESVQWCFKKECKDCRVALYRGPLSVLMTIWREVPTHWPKWKKKQAIEGTIRPTSRPDLDNYVKGILDGLNGIAYHDDSQVTYLMVTKEYGLRAEANVTIDYEDLP